MTLRGRRTTTTNKEQVIHHTTQAGGHLPSMSNAAEVVKEETKLIIQTLSIKLDYTI